MSYTKTSQTTSTPVKLKHCPKCDQDLLVTNFSSTRAKYCKNCKKIVELEQKQEMTNRAMNRVTKRTKISDLKKEVQKVVNKYIRLRDKNLKCISCEKNPVEHCGHYIAQGSSGLLRFDEKNLNGQCRNCNVWQHGNLIGYRIGLVKKYGEEVVKNLEDKRFKTWKWTREELEELLTTYQQKIKELEWGEKNPHEVKEMKADLEKSMDW